jgi:hypothetical protein
VKDIIPDFAWYSMQSDKAKLPKRCPIAGAELCPRYYSSIWLLGNAGITTKVSDKDKIRLDKKWESLQPTIAEEEPSISRADEKFCSLSNFCPEVSMNIFGLFASGRYRYADEIDSGLAAERLAKEKADADDPRWLWAGVTPYHYTECREYSIFSELSSGKKAKTKSLRTGLNPKSRWQVFARDSFTCRYCGKRPPDIILEADHKTSVAQGGKDELENLITACLECNRGKGASNAPS